MNAQNQKEHLDAFPVEVAPKDRVVPVVLPLRNQTPQLQPLPSAVRAGAEPPVPLPQRVELAPLPLAEPPVAERASEAPSPPKDEVVAPLL